MNEKGQSILIVDDTPANLRLLVDILSDRHYLVRPVTDGKLALSAARAEPPDLVLLDIMMPEMSGYEVCEQLKSDQSTKDIPVIFLSAKSEVTDKVKAFSLGGVDYITKPFQAEEVLARVETHLKIRSLQKQLEEKNRALSETLEQLKTTQDQLIHREKMAALGKLIAGVAHEINTPLGAIQASISNVNHAVEKSLQELPELFKTLSPQRQTDFLALVKTAVENKDRLSSKEARQARKILTEKLAAEHVPNAQAIASTLSNMGLYKDIDAFLTLLREPNHGFIIEAAYHLFMQQNNSRNIVNAVDRASKVVFALKKYSHFDDFLQKLRSRISEGIDVVLTLYYNHLKRGIEVITHYEDVPDIVCYPDELNQVWTNIIHNAIQAMEGKGRLEIHIDRYDEYVRVRFTDSGCGIPEEIQGRIFEPFFTTKASGEGSGLGLNIVRRMVHHNQGKIEVESRPGKTTFSVFLPIDSAEKKDG